MKKIFIIGLLLLPGLALAEKPTPEENMEAASLAFAEFGCPSSFEFEYPLQWKVLEYAFIKRPKTQKLIQVCMAGSTAYILREDTLKNGDRKIRAGVFMFGDGMIFLERKSQRYTSYCELEDTTAARTMRANYLCYSPQVAAAYSQGEEYSFRIDKKYTLRRDCTVFFGGGQKKKCGRWKDVT